MKPYGEKYIVKLNIWSVIYGIALYKCQSEYLALQSRNVKPNIQIDTQRRMSRSWHSRWSVWLYIFLPANILQTGLIRKSIFVLVKVYLDV